MSGPLLILSIDVEEDMPDWQILDPVRVSNVQALPRLADICSELGVEPTYLCNYPVATQPDSAEVLKALDRAGGCEIGTHIHAWNTPPFGQVRGRRGDERQHTYYQFELEREAHRAKLETVHRAVTELANGNAPKSFRAGRFGLDEVTVELLIELGYSVDTSVTPLVSHRQDGGPDFRRAPRFPYRPSRSDVRVPGEQPIVEIPVSVALTRRMPSTLQRAYVHLPRRTRLRGILSSDFLRVVDFAWLYPVRFDLAMMKRVADVLVKQKSPVLNVFLHSNELVPGASGRIRTAADVEECFTKLKDILRYCIDVYGARPATLRAAGAEIAPSLGLAAKAGLS